MPSNSSSNAIAFILLGLMFILMFFSALGDSATTDERSYIPAGYSYLTLKDCRLNPEHPPLIKDLGALPLLLLDVKFPTEAPAWKDYINYQWRVGETFLFLSGNDADKIIFWARLPVMLLALFFGWFLFNTAKNLYCNKVGLLTLFFFVTSPAVIAHSRYVTTDIGAAFGFFLGLTTFYKFLEKNDLKSLIIAGISLGIALLLKFSTVLLIPLFIFFGFLWVFLTHFDHLSGLFSFKSRFTHFIKEEGKMSLRLILIFIVAFSIVLAVYQYHVWNYPPKFQAYDTQTLLPSVAQMPLDKLQEITQEMEDLESFGVKLSPIAKKTVNKLNFFESFGLMPLVKADIWLADKPVLRGFGQYLLGVLMTKIRVDTVRRSVYYWGDVSNSGGKLSSPMIYLLKEQLAFHLLTLFVIVTSIFFLLKRSEKTLASFIKWLRDNFVLTMGFIFIGIYWVMSILSPINIGIRYVLPTFPFVYLLVAHYLGGWLRVYRYPDTQNYKKGLYSLYATFIRPIQKPLFLGVIFLWLLVEIILVYPFYLSYYNILAGGSAYGWRISVCCNYDWGQGLKRLNKFVTQNNIKKIKLDYYGSVWAPHYYLGDKLETWKSSKGEPYGWFAISATIRQRAFGRPVRGFQRKHENSYPWLKQYEPVARAGQSIFIYYIE